MALATGKCSWECPYKNKEGYCSIPDRCIRSSKGTSILYETHKPKEPKKDLVEVIRCKDCKYYNSYQGKGMFCTRVVGAEYPRKEEDFCSDVCKKEIS